jgi:hypothetical protein
MIQEWHPRFYLTVAVSSGLLAILNYWLFPMNFTGGFLVGFGVAGVVACLMLAVQSYAILSQWSRLELERVD